MFIKQRWKDRSLHAVHGEETAQFRVGLGYMVLEQSGDYTWQVYGINFESPPKVKLALTLFDAWFKMGLILIFLH